MTEGTSSTNVTVEGVFIVGFRWGMRIRSVGSGQIRNAWRHEVEIGVYFLLDKFNFKFDYSRFTRCDREIALFGEPSAYGGTKALSAHHKGLVTIDFFRGGDTILNIPTQYQDRGEFKGMIAFIPRGNDQQ